MHNPHNPPVRVKAGNRSEDEMAHLWLQVLPVNTAKDGIDARLLLEEAWMQNKLSKDPHDAIALYNLASSLAGQHKYTGAIAAFQRLLIVHPHDERALNGLGASFDNSGDWQQAQKIFTESIAAHPNSCDSRFNLASLDLKHDRPADAEQHFRAMLQHCAGDAGAHSGLGAALLAEGQSDAAQAEFRRALSIDPHDFSRFITLAISRYRPTSLRRP